MKSIAIMCEYNPFHNGHLYHLNKAKEINRESIIILVLGGNFLERGEMSILDKWKKTEIALNQGIDLVVELPFVFATQGADIFSKGFIEICRHLNVENIVFGSESNDINNLKNLANIQLSSKEYNNKVKEYLDLGVNYPTALSKALEDVGNISISTPNDLLGLSYIREIIRQKANITPITIKRTNDYHEKEANNEISSATSIRKLLKKKKDIKEYVPSITYEYLKSYQDYEQEYFKYLKYKIISEGKKLSKYQTVDEGIENRILSHIHQSNSLEELIENVKTKRYTYNKIKRMFTHILCDFTKEEAKKETDIKYIRILGFNENGKKYLNKIKKDITIPIITNIKKNNIKILEIDLKATYIYNLINNIDVKETSKHAIENNNG